MRSLSCFRLKPFFVNADIDEFTVSLKVINKGLRIHYKVHGNAFEVAVCSKKSLPQFTDELWKKTVFELFLKREDESSYTEWNFSPSGNWACYDFDAYRKPSHSQNNLESKPRKMEFLKTADSIDFIVEIDLPKKYQDNEILEFQACSVIKKLSDGSLSYFAIKHPSQKADFHNAQEFSLLHLIESH